MVSFKCSPVKFLRFLCLLAAMAVAATSALVAADEARQKAAEYQSKGYNVLFNKATAAEVGEAST